MVQGARVESLEAIELFKANLAVYMAQARSALEEISGDVVQTRTWIEADRRTYWEREVRRRRRLLEEAQQALFSARLSHLSHGISLEQLAVHRAERAVEEAEARLRTVRRWTREYDNQAQPLVKQMEKLHTILSNDLVKAQAELSHTIETLRQYAEMAPPSSEAPAEPAPPTEEKS